jgi:hypothetical protein
VLGVVCYMVLEVDRPLGLLGILAQEVSALPLLELMRASVRGERGKC